MKSEKLTTREYLVPFILISSLFFLWGIAHGMLDTLNKHFQDMLELSKAKSGMIQFSVYLAYFSMALPAGYFMKKFGYKKGIINKPLISQRHFVLGVIAQFSFVVAQTGVFSYLINFVTDENQKVHFDKDYGPLFLALGFALFMVGRMSGSYLMKSFKPTRMLATYALVCVLLLPIVSAGLGWVSLISLFWVFFFMSIMFPTIFALGIKDLGPKTKKASSFIVMSIVGGAIFPPVMELIADKTSMSAGFFAPIPFFLFILYYAMYGYKVILKFNS